MNPKVLKTYHLDKFNSFSLSCVAEYFCCVCCSEQLRYALDFASRNNLDITILGEGTNVVLNQKIPGLVLKIDIKGKAFKQEGQEIVVEVGVVDVRSTEAPSQTVAKLELAETPAGKEVTTTALVTVASEHPPDPEAV